MKILIIGAGPTGLAAALELAHNGHVPELVERRTAPSELSRAVGIMPITLARMEPYGVSEAILSEAMTIKKVSLNRGTRNLIELDFEKTAPGQDIMHGLPQNRTEELMRDALVNYGGKVRYGYEVTDIETDDARAKVTFLDGREDIYDWVIAADGIGSVAREKLGIAYPGQDLPGVWSIADVDLGDDYDPDRFVAWIQEGRSGEFSFLIPIERNRARIASSTPDALAALPVELNIKRVRRTGTFEISVRQAETYQQGRVLLAGDAAHCHSPVGGRGMNLGIGDGIAAARAILDGTTDRYTAERHKIGAEVLRSSEMGRKIVSSNNPLTKALTSCVLKTVHYVPVLQRAMLRLLTRF